MGASWTSRAYETCDAVLWMARLNLCWLVGVVIGLVVFGVAPATTTAAILTRRRAQGRSATVAEFARTYRAEFVRSQPVVLPVVAVLVLLAGNYQWFSLLGPQYSVPRLVTLGMLALAVGAAAYVAPLYAAYDLPRARYPLQALRIALARPHWTVLLIFVAVVLAFVSARWWVLLPLISVGAWLHLSTALCLRFFAENEDRLADRRPRSAPPIGYPLPVEPLRIH